MSLNDACHSIDNFKASLILEIIKFPNSGEPAMTVHTTPSAAAQTALPATALEGVLPGATTPARRQKLNLRKLLLMGAAAIALTGASWYGYDYWTVGQYLVSTDDAYVKADNTTIAPKVSGYLDRVLVADNEH